MRVLVSLHDAFFDWLERIAHDVLPLLARLLFAATLLLYYWNSAVTKTGDGFAGLFEITSGGFGQIFPKQAEAVLWDVSQMTALQKAVVYAGTYAEFLLPALIVLGLATRLAALGMIVFVVVQTYVDVIGHGATIGSLFDRMASDVIDQRAFWVFALLYLVIRGAGAVSLDGLLSRRFLGRTDDYHARA